MSFLDGLFQEDGVSELEVSGTPITGSITGVETGFLYQVVGSDVDFEIEIVESSHAEAAGKRFAVKVISAEEPPGVLGIIVPEGFTIEDDAGAYGGDVELEQAAGAYREWLCDAEGRWMLVAGASGGATSGGTLVIAKNGVDVGSRPTLNFIEDEAENDAITVSDDAESDSVDITITSRVAVQLEGVHIARRRAINLINGDGVTLEAVDNPGNDSVDVTVNMADVSGNDPRAVFWRRPSSPHAYDAEFTDGTLGGYVVRRLDTWAVISPVGDVDKSASVVANTFRMTEDWRGTFLAMQPAANYIVGIFRQITTPNQFQLSGRFSMPWRGHIGGSGGSVGGSAGLIMAPDNGAGLPDTSAKYLTFCLRCNASNVVEMYAHRHDGGATYSEEITQVGVAGDGEFTMLCNPFTAGVEFWFHNQKLSLCVSTHTFGLALVGQPMHIGWHMHNSTQTGSQVATLDYLRYRPDVVLDW